MELVAKSSVLLVSVFFWQIFVLSVFATKQSKFSLNEKLTECPQETRVFEEHGVSLLTCSSMCLRRGEECVYIGYGASAARCTGCSRITAGKINNQGLEFYRKDCATGWQFFRKSVYCFVLEFKTWAGARDACVKLGGNLAEISDSSEFSFLAARISSLSYDEAMWIGQYVWTGSNNVPGNTSYTYFGYYNNSQAIDPCVVILSDGFWIDIFCTDRRPFICELQF